ncbi:RILP-like protein 1 isoform X2 [Myxocyprinus asiaticus]|uniref:RILP-like protein 1 isoform X2 n=1 Tax=Myxocyprinus asiaticus TaxID=70543 RepID=UPI002222AB56|nr:RILP-like protein 1 isoform X2 [Myxocyprinus asiaticus]
METCEIAVDQDQNQNDTIKTKSCFDRAFSSMTVDDVYDIAKVVGSEVEKLIDSYGKASVEGLVSHIVKVLELLESFAARNQAHKCKEEELLKAFETLQVQQQKKRHVKNCDETRVNAESHDWHQKEQRLKQTVDGLQAQVLQLKEENQELLNHLQCTHSKEDRTQRQEREVMLKLKEVVDKQRDEIRAKVQEISTMSKEVEALQEQQDRLMKINTELRHKQNILQTQMKSAVERRADLETDVCEKQKEIERLTLQLEKASVLTAANNSSAIDLTDKMIIDLKDPNRPCFTKQEVRDMLYERNELKANLFLVKEELAYYQREILNDERCPGFLLDAVRSAIKKQRTVIKSKMLGIPVSECSTDETDGPLFERSVNEDNDTDSTDDRPQESRIRNLFGFLTLSSITRSSGSQTSGLPISSSTWEIINPDEQEDEETQSLHSS